MKSNAVEFVYKNEKDETKVRKVLIMNETEDHLQGFEMSYLSRYQQARVRKALANYQVKDTLSTRKNPSIGRIKGLNDKYFRVAFRTFKKENISTEYFTKKELVDYVVSNRLARNKHAAQSNLQEVLSGKKHRKTFYKMVVMPTNDGYFKVAR